MARYFQPEEIRGLDDTLIFMLDYARHMAGVPFTITEGLASGGSHVGNSSHQRGLAVDLRCRESTIRIQMVEALLAAGFRRIGVYDLHIHADIDPTLPQGVMWVDRSRALNEERCDA